MTCKNYINAVAVADQIILADGYLPLTAVQTKQGNCISFTAGGTTFSVACAGNYAVNADLDVTSASTGEVQVQVVNNGTVIPGSVATVYATAGTTTHVHTMATIPVMQSCKCINNAANIQVQLLNAVTVANANVVVQRVV